MGFFEINCSGFFVCELTWVGGERWGPEGWGPEGGGPKGGGPKSGGPKGGGSQGWGETHKKWGAGGWGPGGWGREGWGAQNFALFFPSPTGNAIRCSLSGGFSRGILVVFEALGRSNVHVGSSLVVVCEPRRPGLVGPPGFHTTTREPKRAQAFKNTTTIQREETQREEKNEFCGGRGKKKSEILGGPGEGRSRGRAV